MNDMAKVFWTGRSQAVRLPKAYRFDDKEVRISRDGDKVILQPAGVADGDGWTWIRSIRPFDDDAARAALDRPRPSNPGALLDDDPSFD